MPVPESEQLVIPFESGPMREVDWFNVVRVEKKRRFFRNKVLVDLIIDDDTCMPALSTIPSCDIDKIEDPDLRYALRFADAAEAAGWFEHSPGHKSSHFVQVNGTEGGFDSQFVWAAYTGIVNNGTDSFMENLRRFAPDYDGNYDD